MPARPRPDLRELPVDGHLVLYDPIERVSHLLNETATAIWIAWRDAPDDPGTIAEALAARYGAPVEQVRRDVDAALAGFEELGLLGDPPSATFRPPQWGHAEDAEPEAPRPDAAATTLAGRFAALDHRFEVATTDPALAAAVHAALAEMADDEPGGQQGADRPRYELVTEGDRVSVLLDGRVLRAAAGPDEAMAFLFWHVHRQALQRTDRLVRLHASAIRVGDVVVALPAPPESGKSTLVAGLVRRGHRYVTDEGVAFDPATFEVTPLPLPITLDEGSWPLFPEVGQPPSTAAGSLAVEPGRLQPRAQQPGGDDRSPARLGICVFHRFRPGTATELRRVEPPEALVLLLENAFGLDDADDARFEALIRVARTVPCWALEHGGLDQAISAVENVIATLDREPR
ncbi:PqqD family peptide modification chaperone [Rhabdothermincola sp.]|uniref:PqqD family peptide modification chaperone n=1 Tax=Rhabdothermincola sp. TaxID=2820405 RepID=UPI002FE2DBBE